MRKENLIFVFECNQRLWTFLCTIFVSSPAEICKFSTEDMNKGWEHVETEHFQPVTCLSSIRKILENYTEISFFTSHILPGDKILAKLELNPSDWIIRSSWQTQSNEIVKPIKPPVTKFHAE